MTRFRATDGLQVGDGGLRLSGVAVRYGEETGPPRLPFRERIEPGAFGNVSVADVRLNVQHRRDRAIARTGGGGLVLTDSPDALRFAADMADTADARDAVTKVRERIMRGSSIEYAPIRERNVGGVLVVERAHLVGVAVVDDGAYLGATVEARESVEIRQDGQGLRVVFGYEQMKVIASSGSLRKETFSSNAFDFALGDPEREINVLLGRSYDNIIGSKLEGSASLVSTPQALVVDVPVLPATQAVADFRAQLAAGSISPGVDVLFSHDGVEDAYIDEPELGNDGVMVRHYRNVVLQAVAVVSRTPRGLEDNAVELRAAQKVRRLWL